MKTLILTLMLTTTPFAYSKVLTPISQADCQNDYLTLMANPVINMTIAYGYFDMGNGTTADKSIQEQFIATMTAPCATWDLKTCGFKKSGTNPTILTRKMTGPDGLIKTVNITVDAPSLSSNDKENSKNPKQKVRSEAVKQIYLNGLRNSEVTIYMGHSRDGGGPDFDPPKLTTDGHTDYDYYHAHPKDKKEVMSVLKENPNKTRILGFFSCSSIRWFSQGVTAGAPASGFIGTDNTYYVRNFSQIYPFIEKIFSYQCIDKLLVPDEQNQANLKSEKKWKVPAKDKAITKSTLTQKTLEKLAGQLRSTDIEVRKEAYREIKSFDNKYYTPAVWEAINDYRSKNSFNSLF